MKLIPVPISLREAREFVGNFHRHNKPPQGGKFAIGASYDDRLVGVAIVGNPVARRMMDGFTAEVVRVCVQDDAPKNTCSFLYGRCWRIWQQMGGKRMITYTLQSEAGSSPEGSRMEDGWRSRTKTQGWQNRPGESGNQYMGN